MMQPKPETKDIKPQQSVAQFLSSQKQQIEAALPKHLTADRMLRIAMTEIRKNPELGLCTKQSLIGAIIQSSQLGLEPGGSLGLAYLIPYKANGISECQFILGYRGMIELARRSGKIITIDSHCVYSKDEFHFEYGIDQKLKHIPSRGIKGEFECVYAFAKLTNGGQQIDVMSKLDIDKIRARSKSATSKFSPWQTDYDEMARKTVVRRLFKYLPMSIEIMNAVSLDDAGENGEQNNATIIDGEVSIAEATYSDIITKSDKESDMEKVFG